MKPSREEREQKRLVNEADRDYPRTLARLKSVLAKIDRMTVERARGRWIGAVGSIRKDVAELVVIACEEQDAVTARQFRDAITVFGKITGKVGLALAGALGSQAVKDMMKEKSDGTSKS